MSLKINSQNWHILQYLKTGKTLTVMQCLNYGWGANLRSRVSDLKKRGYDIKSELVKIPNGYIARYHLETK